MYTMCLLAEMPMSFRTAFGVVLILIAVTIILNLIRSNRIEKESNALARSNRIEKESKDNGPPDR